MLQTAGSWLDGHDSWLHPESGACGYISYKGGLVLVGYAERVTSVGGV